MLGQKGDFGILGAMVFWQPL